MNMKNRDINMQTRANDKYLDDSLDTMNPAPRCPVVLLLDTSGSMRGEPINELNAALRQFVHETSIDEAASMSVELEIITFGDEAKVILPFTPISNVRKNSTSLSAAGGTFIGAALQQAESNLRIRREAYRSAGISSYKPWVILMTDGRPGDNWKAPAEKFREMAEHDDITYLGLEIGCKADHQMMCQILPANARPLKLQGLKFKEFFRWLTDSMKSISTSAISDQDNVRFGSIRSWADLGGF